MNNFYPKINQEKNRTIRVNKNNSDLCVVNNLHNTNLNKINNILHKKSLENNFSHKLKKSTVLCFDDLSLENQNDRQIDEMVHEFETSMKQEIGNFVEWKPEQAKETTLTKHFNDFQFMSKFVLNKAFNREKSIMQHKHLNPKTQKILSSLMKNLVPNISGKINDKIINLSKRFSSLGNINFNYLTKIDIKNDNINLFSDVSKFSNKNNIFSPKESVLKENSESNSSGFFDVTNIK